MRHTYNQNLEYYTRNSCTIYTIAHIFRTQWKIEVPQEALIEATKAAEEAGVWHEGWGAYFSFIYNWATGYVGDKLGIVITSEDIYINDPIFETLIKEGTSFGLGLKFASNWYKEARKDNEITLEEVKKFDASNNKNYGHNHCYVLEYLVDSLGSIDKPIKFNLEALREAVDMGIYYPAARYFIMEDKILDYYLRELKKGTNFQDIEQLPKEHRKALDKAIYLQGLTN